MPPPERLVGQIVPCLGEQPLHEGHRPLVDRIHDGSACKADRLCVKHRHGQDGGGGEGEHDEHGETCAACCGFQSGLHLLVLALRVPVFRLPRSLDAPRFRVSQRHLAPGSRHEKGKFVVILQKQSC
ncbi:DUF2946 domain-containing protein [Vannielia litorea]|nr:DUF2946 domain-containing protein [Vannielia litorea]